MTMFLESPWPVLIVGINVEAILAIALLVTRRGMLLGWMAGAAGAVALAVLLEWAVVTDREAISDAMYDCTAAAETNDAERLLGHISPAGASGPLHDEVRRMFERYEVTLARILDLQITVDRQADPRTAKAAFQVIGQGRDRRGEIFLPGTYGGRLIVNLRREGDRWLIIGYTAEDQPLPQ